MENLTETTIMRKAFDIELMAILLADLETFKSTQQDIAA